MKCPRPGQSPCQSKKFSVLYRTKDDNIDNLDHSHMKCEDCGYQFNHWNESEETIKESFGLSYNLYK